MSLSQQSETKTIVSSIASLWRRAPVWRYLTISAICLTGVIIIYPPQFTGRPGWAHPFPPSTSGGGAAAKQAPTSASTPTVPGKRLSCSQETGLRSIASSVSTKIIFKNTSDKAMQIFWLDFAGTRRPYGNVEPGSDRAQPTFVTHAWLITDWAGRCLGIVVAGSDPGTVKVGNLPAEESDRSGSVPKR